MLAVARFAGNDDVTRGKLDTMSQLFVSKQVEFTGTSRR
jgi:hypothetical protein